MCAAEAKPLIIKRRGEDGNRVISLRIKETTLSELDMLASKTQHSRNELINTILEYGLKKHRGKINQKGAPPWMTAM